MSAKTAKDPWKMTGWSVPTVEPRATYGQSPELCAIISGAVSAFGKNSTMRKNYLQKH